MKNHVNKIGWTLIPEFPPSLCKHHVPRHSVRIHQLTNVCWCNPSLQGSRC